MDWPSIRNHYARVFLARKKARATTQDLVAQRGGIRQNDVSRLLAAESGKGPQVETFVRAIEGLGMTVSSFFLEIEALQKGAPTAENPPPNLSEADHGGAVSEAVGVETVLLGLGEVIERAADRVADRLERLTKTRDRKTRRGTRRDSRRKKAS